MPQLDQAARLIVMTGLPGTGKSVLAEALGRAVGIPVFSKDWLEATLLRGGYPAQGADLAPLGRVGYELLTTLAERQLAIGQSAILDSVASTASIRSAWQTLAIAYNARWRVIECVCSDAAIHRARIAQRQRGIPGWGELDWEDVERARSFYADWREPHLLVDTAQPLDAALTAALAFIEEE